LGKREVILLIVILVILLWIRVLRFVNPFININKYSFGCQDFLKEIQSVSRNISRCIEAFINSTLTFAYAVEL